MTSEHYSLKKELLKVSKQYDIKLNKKQGQCILIDANIANFIIKTLELKPESDIIFEIGSGLGVLTERLISNVKKLYAVEKDRRFVEYLNLKLKNNSNFEIKNGDALKVVFPFHTKLVSNVPYHISGPLIKKICLSNQKAEKIVLMLQEEFINRLLSKPQPKNYGRLSVVGGIFFKIEKLRDVQPNNFFPEPKVNSGIISLQFKNSIPSNLQVINTRKQFFEFLGGIFPYKNKTVRRCLSIFFKNIDCGNFPLLNKKLHIYDKKELLENIIRKINFDAKLIRLWELTPLEIFEIFNEILLFR